ncbi:unnamed protein product [Ostreobium quekettii]|uniref:Ion transport domain-containing protein n=1 Tax=Ostreobium quekettii TaxID=121088 RepID=A0A8S1IW99_9CHLO|nr:unnamed protein product [Ostreobium quekettii]
MRKNSKEQELAPQRRKLPNMLDVGNLMDSIDHSIESVRGVFRKAVGYAHSRARFAANGYKYRTLQKFAPTESMGGYSSHHGVRSSDGESSDPSERPMLSLHSSKLSFFDEFKIVCGVPVFELTPRREPPINSWEPCAHEEASKHGTTEEGCFLTTETVTCVAFSDDSSLLVSGHSDGAVRVWDAEHGHLLDCLANKHQGQVSDVCFSPGRADCVLSCDWSGSLVTWDFGTDRTDTADCGFRWSNFHLGSQPFAPQFSSSGNIVLFPIKTTLAEESFRNESELSRSVLRMKSFAQHDVGSTGHNGDELIAQESLGAAHVTDGGKATDIVQAFVLFACATHSRSKPAKELVVPLLDESTNSGSLAPFFKLSQDGRGLLAGFSDLNRSFLVLWPNFLDNEELSYRLEAGNSNMGAWRRDARMVVTWGLQVDTDSGLEHSEDPPPGGACYVWDLTKFHGSSAPYRLARAGHPKFVASEPILLQHQSEHQVVWCEFLCLEGDWCVAQSLLCKDMMVIIWDVKKRSPTRVLESGLPVGLPAKDDAAGDVVERMMNLSLPKIMRGIAASPDSRWLGFFNARMNKGMVWDTAVGVQVLSLELPEGSCPSGCKDVHLLFSKDGKFVMFGGGLSRMLLWLPRNFGPQSLASVQLLDLETLDRSAHTLDSRRHPTSCSFSSDGRMLGLAHAYTPSMLVWNLEDGVKYTLSIKNAPKAKEKNALVFSDFAMSKDGHRIAACMSDNSVLLWVFEPSGGDQGDYFVQGQLTSLRAAFYPKRAICFSQTPDRKETVVICEDDGTLVWVLVDEKVELDRTSSILGYNFHCKFSQDGESGVQMRTPQSVVVWNLVRREATKTVHFNLRLGPSGEFPFPLNVGLHGESAVVGQMRDSPGMLVMTPETTEEYLSRNVVALPNRITVSDCGRWVLTDDLSASWQPPSWGSPSGMLKGPKPMETVSVGGLWVRDVSGKSEPKKLAAPDLDPSMFIAISQLGDKVACLTKHKRLIVWTPYATSGCIPDYNMVQAGRWGAGTVGDGVDELLTRHGVSLLNYPDESGMNILFQATQNNDIDLIRRLLAWVDKNKMKISMRTDMRGSDANSKRAPNALQLALQRRSPEAARVLVEFLMSGVTTEAAQAEIFKESLLNVLRVYPSLFYDVMSDKRLFLTIGEHLAPERAFQHHDLMATPSETLIPAKKSLKEMWDRSIEARYDKYQRAMSVNIEALAKVIPYPDIAHIGKEGLLRALVANRTSHQMFGARPIASMVDYKWHSYARELLLEELSHYALLLGSFTAFCIFLGHLQEFQETDDAVDDVVAVLAAISLLMSIILAIFNLIRKLFQIITLAKEEGWKGIFLWSNSHWNWIETVSYLVVVFLIPFAIVRGEATQDVDLSSLSAIVVIMLWWKALYYLGPFRSTGSLVVMIREILKDIIIFMLLAFGILFGFGTAFFVLYRHARSAKAEAKAACSMFNEGALVGINRTDPTIASFLSSEGMDSLSECLKAVNGTSTAKGSSVLSDLNAEESRDVLNAFGTLARTLLSMFGFLLGDFDLETLWEAESFSVAVILFILYAVAMMIVLLNLLIAIMGGKT